MTDRLPLRCALGERLTRRSGPVAVKQTGLDMGAGSKRPRGARYATRINAPHPVLCRWTCAGHLDGPVPRAGGEEKNAERSSCVELVACDYRPMALERVTVDPAQMGGVPCIRGLRVTVSLVLGQLAAGRTHEQLLEDYPYLEREDVTAALEYAAAIVNEREVPMARPA